MFKKLMELFIPARHRTVESTRIRQKVDRKEKSVEKKQQEFEKTITYYLGKASGVIHD